MPSKQVEDAHNGYTGVWGKTYNSKLAQGHDHGSAAYEADKAELRAKKRASKKHVRLRSLGDRMIVEIEGKEVINTYCPIGEQSVDIIATI